jgi:hypothetical protein
MKQILFFLRRLVNEEYLSLTNLANCFKIEVGW